MKKIVFAVLCLLMAVAAAVNAGQQYNHPALDNVSPGSVPQNAACMMYGYDGSAGYYVPYVASDGSISVKPTSDKARSAVSFYAVGATAGTTGTETAITLTRSLATGATTTGNSFVITSGKKFRITQISLATRGSGTATAQATTFNVRLASGATGTTSTPVIFSARSATPATAAAWERVMFTIPDGYEITGDGTLQFGVTASSTYATNAPTWDVNIIGYEY